MRFFAKASTYVCVASAMLAVLALLDGDVRGASILAGIATLAFVVFMGLR